MARVAPPAALCSYGENVPLLRSVLSLAFIVVTGVYGYIWSHRAITAVLKDAARGGQELAGLRAGHHAHESGSGLADRANGDEESIGTFNVGDATAHHRHSLSPVASVERSKWTLFGMGAGRER